MNGRVSGYLSRLLGLGYDQASANWLVVKHQQCGTMDELAAEIARMERERDAR